MEPRNIDLNDNAWQENPGGEGGAGDAKSPIRRERSRSPNRNLPESEVPPLPAGEGPTSAAAAESSGGDVQERTCIVCGRVFEGAKSMHGHLRVHTEEERRSAVQPRLFSTWDVYLRMLELHDGNIPADLLTRLERNLKGREEEMEAARLEGGVLRGRRRSIKL
ncbi:hypothetical protein Nepgr_026378 [Nepenthes gracilis]|uniref:C2H2-type domain-containing protein n=1 Tax=Nepenthes gracilis TaxID=150966 RepID=A0AAD3T7R7_NEPGR|nr:hypothetical protein Nepgr_026378 [Nepenthes gracilis]